MKWMKKRVSRKTPGAKIRIGFTFNRAPRGGIFDRHSIQPPACGAYGPEGGHREG